MSSFRLRRFADPTVLRALEPARLFHFLTPFRAFLEQRGVAWPESAAAFRDYEGLTVIFMTPDRQTPKELIDALYYVDELATPEGLDRLLSHANRRGIPLGQHDDLSPADVALELWLSDRHLVERAHAELYFHRARSYDAYRVKFGATLVFSEPTPEQLRQLEHALAEMFEAKKRGRGVRAFVYPREGQLCFLIRHGEPYKREESADGPDASSVWYRPLKYDVVLLHLGSGDLQINARAAWQKQLYSRAFGKHLFGDEYLFPSAGKYTLEPLRTQGEAALTCIDVPGLEWVRLKEIQFDRGGPYHEITICKADDIFAALKARGETFPEEAELSRAVFLLKFADAQVPRSVTLRAPLSAQYTRDEDAAVVEDWLTRRGFTATEGC